MLKIIFATREPEKYGVETIKEYIEYGVSPRASIDLYKAAKASAFLSGKDFVTPVDIANVLEEVLRHRIILNYNAESEDINQNFIIQEILNTIPIP